MIARLRYALPLTLILAALACPSAAQVRNPRRVVPAVAAVVTPVTVVVVGLRSDRGLVLGGLYRSAERWLVADHADFDCRAPIVHGRAECAFPSLPPGPVAFAGMHDENGDGRFDRDFFGLPSEGYAFSNDAREPFGPPSFTAASFAVGTLTVHARYGI